LKGFNFAGTLPGLGATISADARSPAASLPGPVVQPGKKAKTKTEAALDSNDEKMGFMVGLISGRVRRAPQPHASCMPGPVPHDCRGSRRVPARVRHARSRMLLAIAERYDPGVQRPIARMNSAPTYGARRSVKIATVGLVPRRIGGPVVPRPGWT
jgi:hypothetical protein